MPEHALTQTAAAAHLRGVNLIKDKTRLKSALAAKSEAFYSCNLSTQVVARREKNTQPRKTNTGAKGERVQRAKLVSLPCDCSPAAAAMHTQTMLRRRIKYTQCAAGK
jgi:hypothetical protein